MAYFNGMKTIFSTLMLLAVFLVCDPYSGADYFVVTGLPTQVDGSNVPLSPDPAYGFKLDISAIPPGAYTVRAKACSDLWGCSADSVPFSFTRPATGEPAHIRLVK